MSAQWGNARILQRGRREYRLSIDGGPVDDDWSVAEEHSVCLDASADRAAVQDQLDELCEPPVSYQTARNLLADLRGHVLGQSSVAMVEHKYATFWLRVGARIGDILLFMPVAYISFYFMSHSTASWMCGVWFCFGQCAFLVYEILMHGIYGQTLGKMGRHVRVVDISERPLSMRQAVLRVIVPLVLMPVGMWIYMPQVIRGEPLDFSHPSSLETLYTFLCGAWFWLDGLTMLTNSKRRALHDFIAGSVVVREK